MTWRQWSRRLFSLNADTITKKTRFLEVEYCVSMKMGHAGRRIFEYISCSSIVNCYCLLPVHCNNVLCIVLLQYCVLCAIFDRTYSECYWNRWTYLWNTMKGTTEVFSNQNKHYVIITKNHNNVSANIPIYRMCIPYMRMCISWYNIHNIIIFVIKPW